MPLGNYKSQCGQFDQKITCKDRGTRSTYIAHNNQKHKVGKYHIDGDIIKDNRVKKCDWIVSEETQLTAYLIELKGVNVDEAIQQLESTECLLRAELQYYHLLRYRIVPTKVPTHLYNTAYKKFKSKHPKPDEFKCKEVFFEENLN